MSVTTVAEQERNLELDRQAEDLARRLFVAWIQRHEGLPLTPKRVKGVRAYYRVLREFDRFGREHPDAVERYLRLED